MAKIEKTTLYKGAVAAAPRGATVTPITSSAAQTRPDSSAGNTPGPRKSIYQKMCLLEKS